MRARAMVGALAVAMLLAPAWATAQTEPGHDHEGGSEAQVGAGEGAHWEDGGTEGLAHLAAAAIQERIDAASPGAVIAVPSGMYHGDLVVDRRVILQADAHVMVVGDGDGSVIEITGDGAVLRGFHVTNSGVGPVGGPAGIRVTGDDVTVEGNLVEDTYMGIAVYGVTGVRLLGNTIRGRAEAVIEGEGHATSAQAASEAEPPPGATGGHDHSAMTGSAPTLGGRPLRGDGITLWDATDAVIRGNTIEHARDGIFLSFGGYVLIDGNRVLDSRYALHNMFGLDLFVVENTFAGNLSGAVLMYGGPVLLLRNEISGSASPSTGFGVLLKDVAGVDAVENVLLSNRIGIQVDGPAGDLEHETIIHGNTVALNRYGVSLYPSANATFYRNSFVENTVQVVAQGHGVAGKNTWAFEGVGNYWSDYRGYDMAGEGLGDVPHHEGGSVESLMVRAPVLQALASGPAFGLLSAVEDRWVEHEAIVVDPLPLMEPHSPAVGDGLAAGAASAALAAGGLVAVTMAGAAIVALRRPLRRGRTSHAT
jgi:nitrous oxidase accessory protein